MQFTFADGTLINPIIYYPRVLSVRGAERQCLEFVFNESDYTIDAIKALLENPNNSKELTAHFDDGAIIIYSDYIIQAGISLTPSLVTPETPDNAAVYENRIAVIMAQITYAEKQVELRYQELKSMNLDTMQAVADIYETMI